MAYTRPSRNNMTRNNQRISGKRANVQLNVTTPDGDYMCETGKVYNDKLSVIQDLDTSIIKLSTFEEAPASAA